MNYLRSILHKIHSRRQINSVVLFCFLFFMFFTLYAEDLPDPENSTKKTGARSQGELINLDLNDASVSLFLRGRWKGTLQASFGFALTPFGASALTGDTPFFAQEGDLTLSLWILDRWFVEANFMDNSALNTYRAGYQGARGEVVRYEQQYFAALLRWDHCQLQMPRRLRSLPLWVLSSGGAGLYG